MRKTTDNRDCIMWQGDGNAVGFHRIEAKDVSPWGGVLVRLVTGTRGPQLNRTQARRLRDWLTEVLDDE